MIPKIIHQIYFDFHNKKIEEIPLFNTSSKRIQEFNPDYEYKLWSEKECEDVVKENLPQHYDFYKSMKFKIQQIDYMRFVLLYVYGGIYIDLDLIPIRKLDSTLNQKFFSYSLRDLIPGHHEFVQNDFMGSIKNFKLWEIIFAACEINYHKKLAMEVYEVRKGRFVLHTTGPSFFSKILKKVLPNYNPQLYYVFTKWKNNNWKKVDRSKYLFENYVSTAWAHSVNKKLTIKDSFYLKEDEL
tara:strand:+ start:30 stop:752 length:723 start_codon:yes stop_codon:yes gene_type:complete